MLLYMLGAFLFVNLLIYIIRNQVKFDTTTTFSASHYASCTYAVGAQFFGRFPAQK